MAELELMLVILTAVTCALVLYVILLRHNVKMYKKKLALKKHCIDPNDSPTVIKLKCIDAQLENIGKKL